MKYLTKVNRLEVIDWTPTAEIGRAFVKRDKENFDVSYDLQDNGKTLKIFLTKIKGETK